ncbi:MAG: hypothetical protein QM756_10485 [Polyangiaceae bacterium]
MKTAVVNSPCECQARLGAELDERRVVVRGWARDPRRGREELAPANAIGAERSRFDVGWSCPFCTRNVLRSFEAAALSYRDAPVSPS